MLFVIASAVLTGTANSISVPGTNLNDDSQASKIEKIDLAFKTPTSAACPARASMEARIYTDKPGSVQYFIMQKGGSISGPFTIESSARNNGRFSAVFTREILFQKPVNAEYLIAAAGNSGSGRSNWTRLIANCD